jgi:hypothetical protein
MDNAAAEVEVISEATVFLKYFGDLPDPRPRSKVA